MFVITVSAGFPSPAENYIEGPLDLNRHLIHRPAATFFVRVKGDSMIGTGIYCGDLLIVDRAEEARHGNIIIAVVNGELIVKRLSKQPGHLQLLPENPEFEPIDITEDMDFQVWGVVTRAIHYLQ